MRGEDKISALFHSVNSGSPPHARGRLRRSWMLVRFRGITPACAGKTCSPRGRRKTSRDHPRMRGEDERVNFVVRIVHGSPPHARGRLFAGVELHFSCGITPACAGKTCSFKGRQICCRDHPRMRGEDHTVEQYPRPGQGSPPHARGRRDADTWRNELARITPACAGKTLASFSPGPVRRDHPRMRGEDTVHTVAEPRYPGSPPHARGRPSTDATGKFPYRITPACAGKTNAVDCPRDTVKDHPRMRGEDTLQ